MSFSYREVLPDVFHIEDAMGVCMTLLAGRREAWLLDSGYGLEDVAAFSASLTDKPVRLILTHGHYDHILGASWFDGASLFEEDFGTAEEHGGESWRRRALDAAAEKGIAAEAVPYLAAELPAWNKLEEKTLSLGGLTVQVIRCPGTTPGSAVLFVPERELLLTGDNWNPCTWVFFPEALPVRAYLRNMREILGLPFRRVLCSHSGGLHERRELEDFLGGLTEERIRSAEPVDTGAWLGIRTARVEPAAGMCLVFDADKAYKEQVNDAKRK